MDDLDAHVIDLFAAEPRIGVLEASRRLGVARGTVQARLDRLAATGVVTGWGPDLSPDALGFPVMAFLTLEIRQGSGHDAIATTEPLNASMPSCQGVPRPSVLAAAARPSAPSCGARDANAVLHEIAKSWRNVLAASLAIRSSSRVRSRGWICSPVV